ncbi:O-antigen ligase family protein [bacterium]|nr:O-antigen ligase family protein [bacterium]MBT4335233.1 O-antigen ligase family protein [bacterium]MBT4763813.1 O-antigen ligase family protein [bacterium]MBT5401183.1 O-antigen ligase family protein [bacterium]MBT5942857.1 O-antigen ligase family protein [bacterium]
MSKNNFLKIISLLINYGTLIFVFLLPWQVRWIYHEAILNGQIWEYGRFSLYGTEILLILILLLSALKFIIQKKEIETLKPNLIFNINFWLVLLVIWSALTIIWSADFYIALNGLLRLLEGIALFYLVVGLSSSIKHKISYTLIISGLIQSLIAIFQFIYQWSLSNKWLGMSLLNPGSPGISVIETATGRFLRSYGTLPHPNILAGFLVITILITIILINRESIKKRLYFLFSSLIVLSLGLILTFSRAGIISLLSCLIIYLIYSKIKKRHIKKIALSLLLILFILSFFTLFYSDLVLTRFNSTSRLEVKSNTERLESYNQALSIVDDTWYKGLGLGQYTLRLAQLYPDLPGYIYQPVHDSGMLTLAELGLWGLLIFSTIILFIFLGANSFWLLIVAVLILGLFDHYFRSMYFGIMLWWLVLAIGYKK